NVAVRSRILPFQPGGNRLYLCARLAQRHAGLQTSKDAKMVVLAVVNGGAERVRNPEFGARSPEWRKAEARRHHADYRVRLTVEHDRLADDGGVGIEAPPPKRVT